MAAAVARLNRSKGIALVLLVTLAARQTLWDFAPDGLAGVASKGLGSLAALVLLLLVYELAPVKGRLLAAVAAVYAWHETQTVVCTVSYMLSPWPIQPGQAMCSAKLGFDLGALGLLAFAILARMAVRAYRLPNVANR